MSATDQEIEVKFFLRDLPGLAQRLERLGGQIQAERVRETNLRFDTPDGALTQASRVLRLRQDAGAVMTYKGAAEIGAEVSARVEIEFGVSDFGAARCLLEALGYRVSVVYEKFRTTYAFRDVLVVLDEMPYGNFAEIEGPGAPSIHAAADALGLRWEARITASYLALFNNLRAKTGLAAENLSFSELAGVVVTPDDLGLAYAD